MKTFLMCALLIAALNIRGGPAVRVSAGQNSIVFTNLAPGLYFRLKGQSWTNAVLQRTGWPSSGYWATVTNWCYPSNTTPSLTIEILKP